MRRLAHYQIFELEDQMLELDGTRRLRAGMLEEGLRYLNELAGQPVGGSV